MPAITIPPFVLNTKAHPRQKGVPIDYPSPALLTKLDEVERMRYQDAVKFRQQVERIEDQLEITCGKTAQVYKLWEKIDPALRSRVSGKGPGNETSWNSYRTNERKLIGVMIQTHNDRVAAKNTSVDDEGDAVDGSGSEDGEGGNDGGQGKGEVLEEDDEDSDRHSFAVMVIEALNKKRAAVGAKAIEDSANEATLLLQVIEEAGYKLSKAQG